MGRSINVISLAGIAFAVGMVVDAAIVVLENIYRHRASMGHAGGAQSRVGRAPGRFGAAVHGLRADHGAGVRADPDAWNSRSGQLFRDIAVAISVAVHGCPCMVSITVIPALSKTRLLSRIANHFRIRRLRPFAGDGFDRARHRGAVHWAIARLVPSFASRVAFRCRGRHRGHRVGCLSEAWQFLPKLEYLPEGNRNLDLRQS